MVFLGTCHICGDRTFSAHVHPECHAAKLEDLLSKIQQALLQGKPIPAKVKKAVLETEFTTLKEYLGRKKNRRESAVHEETRRMTKAIFLSGQASEFDRRNPSKKVIRYGTR